MVAINNKPHRIVVLDTETTGLEPSLGHKIIEIGCIELLDRKLTTRNFHYYLDPERDIDPGAQAVHGISNEQLVGKPHFAEIADELWRYLQDAEIVIHNAAFDLGFLNAEFKAVGRTTAANDLFSHVTDSLMLARSLFPGKKNSLDALCERLDVDHSGRTVHGALLDAQLLAEVYLALTRGQDSLMIEFEEPASSALAISKNVQRPVKQVLATTEEIVAHEQYLDAMAKKAPALWRL